MWMEYIGPKYPGGVVEDYEHTKFYWGPENDWKCDIPVRLAGMILQEKGVEMFLPCLAPDEPEKPQEEALPEKPQVETKPKRRRKKK